MPLFANVAMVFLTLSGRVHIIIVCERGEVWKLPVIIWVKLANVQAFGNFP